MFEEQALFTSGTEGYHTFRIPALAVTTKGTLLAFCEGRVHDSHDTGQIRLLLRRSHDHGKTWGPIQLVAEAGPHTAGNPAPVVDRSTGIIWLPFTQNRADGPEALIIAGKAARTVWLTYSADDGASWAPPREITKYVKQDLWTWYATGPGHGVQLQNGRLVIPCDYVLGTSNALVDGHFHAIREFYARAGHGHVIYSDDHGATWHIGGIAQAGTNEAAVVETVDGSLYLNCRNYVGSTKRRAYAWSRDHGDTFGEGGWDEKLVEPICQASICRLTDEVNHDRNRVLFANPASTTARERLTVRLSYDECVSWNDGKVLHEGLSAYSDLCVTRDLTICCLYERGKEGLYETLTLARFDLDWLTDGKDRLRISG
ncbi:MAG: exo-alpha-sialidase [Chloroflexi bacterium]|nr:exo-alpha-sialidase [Chloroflexota bacterium]